MPELWRVLPSGSSDSTAPSSFSYKEDTIEIIRISGLSTPTTLFGCFTDQRAIYLVPSGPSSRGSFLVGGIKTFWDDTASQIWPAKHPLHISLRGISPAIWDPHGHRWHSDRDTPDTFGIITFSLALETTQHLNPHYPSSITGSIQSHSNLKFPTSLTVYMLTKHLLFWIPRSLGDSPLYPHFTLRLLIFKAIRASAPSDNLARTPGVRLFWG